MSTQTHQPEPSPAHQHIRDFGRALDRLRAEVEADLGARDLAHIEHIRRTSRKLEITGRCLLQFSFEPLGFTAGVVTLGVHKCLELMEIGHMALHGAYEHASSDPALSAEGFRWRAPIDEASWRHEHNVRHHQYTNIAGRDPDIDFGRIRLSSRIPFKSAHRFQPVTNLLTWLGFATVINMHVTGMTRAESSGASARHRGAPKRAAKHSFLSKTARYYGKELLLYPALAGPFFWKVALGNLLSDVGRDICAGAIIYCGHVGAKDYPEGTKAGSRGRWYAMQVESASNVELVRPLSILCGALDKQIKHHLFPRLPPNRLREIAPRVRAVCEQYGVEYRSAGWVASLREVMKKLRFLSRTTAPT